MRVGRELKAARTKAGISVEVMSKRTKITVRKLVALEENDFKNLPTGLYLLSAVRAYAREVHIDPEPIVERLRAKFAEKDALDALHALDATGALDAKNLADGRRSKGKLSNLLRDAAIAAGVVLMVAGAGAYLHDIGRIAMPSLSLSSPVPATTVATAVDVPQQAAGATHKPAPTKPIEFPSPARIEEPADTPANIEESRPETPTTAP